MSILTDILNLLFPRLCPACGKKLAEGEECLCLDCLMDLPRTRFECMDHSYMEKLHWTRLPIVKSGAIFMYTDDRVRSIVHRFKYFQSPDLARYIVGVYAEDMKTTGFFDGVDAIVPVPLHWLKKMKRGYNQSEYVAKGISLVTGIPILTGVVERTRYTKTQTHKSKEERRENVKGVFRCTQPEKIRGKHILVVDDVFTTGSTIGECIRAMMIAADSPTDGIVLTEEASVTFSIFAVAYAGRKREVTQKPFY